jgi:hypothetical protein
MRLVKNYPPDQQTAIREKVLAPSTSKDHFDWTPIKAQGVRGFVAEAQKRGVFGLRSSAVKKKDKRFHEAFTKWLKSQSEDKRAAFRNQVYAPPDERKTWPTDIEGWVELIRGKGLLGLSATKFMARDKTLHTYFTNWVRTTQPESEQRAVRERVLAPSQKADYFNWAPIKTQGIQGFVTEAQNRGLIGLSSNELREQDVAYYVQFFSWLQTQPEDQRPALRNQILTPSPTGDHNKSRST